jgi:hypothetical protein
MLKRLLAVLVLVAALAAACGPATNPNGSGGLDGMETPMDGLQTEMPLETPAT